MAVDNNYMFGNSYRGRAEDTFYSVKLIIGVDESTTIYGYILKSSSDGENLFNILKDGEFHPVILTLGYLDGDTGGGQVCKIYSFVQEFWNADDAFLQSESNKLVQKQNEWMKNLSSDLQEVVPKSAIKYSSNYGVKFRNLDAYSFIIVMVNDPNDRLTSSIWNDAIKLQKVKGNTVAQSTYIVVCSLEKQLAYEGSYVDDLRAQLSKTRIQLEALFTQAGELY